MVLIVCFWALGVGAVPAEELELNPDRPGRYTVMPGDTLWSIAARFLASPWRWSEIWHDNPQVGNPNLIYPGDVLVFSVVGGAPRVEIETPSELRLSPQVRSSPLDAAIPAIPLKIISPFLTRPRVVSEAEFEEAPYVVDFVTEHVVVGSGDQVYVRSIPDGANQAYTIVRGGQLYHDFDTGEVLGREAVHIADSLLEQPGDPATVNITRAEKEVRIGDRLLPFRPEPLRTAFQPHAPRKRIRAHILSVLDGVTQIGQYSVVSIDKGTADGLEAGHVLEIRQRGREIRDIVSPRFGETLVAPEQKAGELIVFRPFRRISFALVMNASRFVHIDDIAQTP